MSGALPTGQWCSRCHEESHDGGGCPLNQPTGVAAATPPPGTPAAAAAPCDLPKVGLFAQLTRDATVRIDPAGGYWLDIELRAGGLSWHDAASARFEGSELLPVVATLHVSGSNQASAADAAIERARGLVAGTDVCVLGRGLAPAGGAYGHALRLVQVDAVSVLHAAAAGGATTPHPSHRSHP